MTHVLPDLPYAFDALEPYIDARTMEILSAGTGAPPDIDAEVSKWVSWVDSNEPSKF